MEKIILKQAPIWSATQNKDGAIDIIGMIGLRKYFYHTKAEAKHKYLQETQGKIARGEVYDLQRKC